MRTIAAAMTVAALFWLVPSASAQCAGRCGDEADDELSCYCDSSCVGAGDCCPDAADECPAHYQAGATCAEHADDNATAPAVCSVGLTLDGASRCQRDPDPAHCDPFPNIGPLGFLEYCLADADACVGVLTRCLENPGMCVPPPSCLEDPVGCLL